MSFYLFQVRYNPTVEQPVAKYQSSQNSYEPSTSNVLSSAHHNNSHHSLGKCKLLVQIMFVCFFSMHFFLLSRVHSTIPHIWPPNYFLPFPLCSALDAYHYVPHEYQHFQQAQFLADLCLNFEEISVKRKRVASVPTVMCESIAGMGLISCCFILYIFVDLCQLVTAYLVKHQSKRWGCIMNICQ